MEEKKKYKYYLDENNGVYAKDEEGNEFAVMSNGFIPLEKGTIDIMWGGLAEEHVDEMVKEYDKFLSALRSRAEKRKQQQ